MKAGNLIEALARFLGVRRTRVKAQPFLEDDQVNSMAECELTVEDKQIFEALCQFLWVQGDWLPLIFDVEHAIYTQQGITLPSLKRLQTAGLIHFEAAGFVKRGFGKHTRLFYCGKPTKIGFQADADNYLDLGHVLLTGRGKKLAAAVPVTRNQLFYEYVISRWFEQGLLLSSIQVDQNYKHKVTPNHHACSVKAPGWHDNH